MAVSLKTIQSVVFLGSTSDGVIRIRRKQFWTSERHLNALEKIKIGREFSPDCLLLGYLELVTRCEPITDEEATAIGLLVTVRLYRFREKFMFNNPMGAGQRAGENIEAQFREELIDIRIISYITDLEPTVMTKSND